MSQTDRSHRQRFLLGIMAHTMMVSLAVTIAMHEQVDAEQFAARLPLPFVEKEVEPISFLFTGDIMLGRYIATLTGRNGGDFPFTYMPELIEAAEIELEDELDFVVGNLEGPITTSNYVNPGTAMIFNFNPAVVPYQLQKAGFTTLSMANNHTLDMGADGIQQTFDFLMQVGIDGFGHPDTPTGQYSSHSYVVDGKTITFLGLNDAVISLDEEAALLEIERLDEESDFLIVSVHWGPEYLETAPTYIEEMAHSFVDAGADFIHGHHPHRVQNVDVYNGVPIYYSLGNFVFDQYWSSYTQEGQVALLKLVPTEDGFILDHQDWMVDLVNKGEPKLRQ